MCKADCTVDSVIPVYIHHSVGGGGEDDSMGLGSEEDCGVASTIPLAGEGDNQSTGRRLENASGLTRIRFNVYFV